MNLQDATRHFLARFNKQETEVNPEETQDAAESTPAEEVIIDVPTDPPVEAPVEPVPAVPIAPSIDEQIVSGSASIQAALSKYRQSKTAEHDAQMALASAQTMILEAEGAEGKAKADANEAISMQITNLETLRDRLNS